MSAVDALVHVGRFTAVACAFVIFFRALIVIMGMHPNQRKGCYAAWLGFVFAYALLGVSALGSALAVCSTPPRAENWQQWAGHLTWLHASAGLILFDRRRRGKWGRRAEAKVDPDATAPLGSRLT